MGVPATTCKGMPVTSHGAYQKDNPVDFAIPLLIIQILIVLAVTRMLAIVMRPLRQPRVVAEIIGGILLGPTALGRSVEYRNKIFPTKSLTVLETVANLGLIFFLFMVGLELDLKTVLRTGKQAMVISLAGIITPFASGVGIAVILRHTIAKEGKFSAFTVFMGVAMSITAFPVLARILAERRLLTTDVGRVAMSAAAVDDVCAWILLALAVALSGNSTGATVAIWILLTGVAFVTVMFTLVRKLMTWVAKHVTENEPVKEIYICITFAGVLICSFVTDVIGIHSIFGAFVFGLVIPKDGPLASGLKTNIQSIHGARSGGLMVLVISTACVGKIVGVFISAVLYGIAPRKALTLGFLMNTKGLVELIVLNIGKERGVLNDETFAIMVIMALFTTFMTTPIVMALYKPARNPVPYMLRKLEICRADDELRIIACVHGVKNIPGIISLVELTRGKSKQPMKLHILHLVELSERSSAIVMVHKARKNGRVNLKAPSDTHIAVAFEAFGHLSEVKVRPMTAIAGFSDMHDDVCSTAADKRSALLVLPFHKLHKLDGTLETLNAGFQVVNLRVLKHAPCSVGIFIHRGIQISADGNEGISHKVAVLFFGGPDDREALAVGCRMAEHPGVQVKIIRFKPTHEVDLTSPRRSSVTKSLRKSIFESEPHLYNVELDRIDFDKEEETDCNTLGAIREHQTVLYEEKTISNPIESVVELVRGSDYGLALVGRGRTPSKMIASLNSLCIDYEELGPIGSVLAASDSGIKASVLVLQQYTVPLQQGHVASASPTPAP